METEKFITVLTFTFASEVAIIRGRLESEGITCFVQDELTVQVNPLYSNAIGGVKLQVKESDLNQAIEILKETGYIKGEDLQSPKESPCLREHYQIKHYATSEVKTICPICGSEEVVKSKKAGWFFLFTSFLLLPFCGVFSPFLQKTYYCLNCKEEFKRKPNFRKDK
jgi:Zn finger protein HypA/HybF involved in hydrogenase expression